jgi:hypothetical protein
MNNGLPTQDFQRSVHSLLRSGTNLIAGLLNGGIYTSSNGGASWTQRSTQFVIYALVKAGSTVFAGTQDGLMKSTDNGETWTMIANDVQGVPVTALYAKADDQLYIGTVSAGMYVSYDGGITLEPHSDGLGDYVFVNYIGADGGKLLSGWSAWDNGTFHHYAYESLGVGLWYQNLQNLATPEDRAARPDAAGAPILRILGNPVRDVLRFSTNVDWAQVAGVQVVNTGGQVVRDLTPADAQTPIPVHDLPNGPHFLRLGLLDGTVLTRPFTVMAMR